MAQHWPTTALMRTVVSYRALVLLFGIFIALIIAFTMFSDRKTSSVEREKSNTQLLPPVPDAAPKVSISEIVKVFSGRF
jgi:hypothetical protein